MTNEQVNAFRAAQGALDEVIMKCKRCSSATCVDMQEGMGTVVARWTEFFARHLTRGCAAGDLSIEPVEVN